MKLNYFTTWKTKNNGFFQGSEFKPATLNEKLAIAVLAGATLFITLERIVWALQGKLHFWF